MIMPTNHSVVKNDVVLREVVNSRHNFAEPGPRISYANVELNLLDYTNAKGQTAYDRYQELAGTYKNPANDGRTLRQELKNLIESDNYKNLPEFTGHDALDNEKVREIGRIIGIYREAARAEVLSVDNDEFPELSKFLNENLSAQQDAWGKFHEKLGKPRDKG